MGKRIASLYADISADTTKLKKGLDETKTQLQKTGDGIKNFAGGLTKAFGFAVAELAILKKAFEFGKEQAMVEFTIKKFDRLSESIGTTSDVLLNDLKGATRGLVSDMELMESATNFMTLGLVKTHDEAVRLTSVAGQLGMNMNQLVLTLTNQTTMRFDALGVAVDGFDEKVAALKATGMSANDAFNEAFLQQAEEQIEKVGSIADSSAASFLRMEASVKNLTDELKQRMVPVLADAADGLYWILNYTKEVDKAFSQHKDNTVKIAASYKDYKDEILRAAEAGRILAKWQIDEVALYLETGKVVKAHEKEIQLWVDALDLATESEYNLQKAVHDAAAETAIWDEHEKRIAATFRQESIPAIDDVKDATNNAADAMREYSEELLFAIASQGLTDEQALGLAYAMGLVDESTVLATEKTKLYKSWLDQKLITEEEYYELIKNVNKEIQNVPASKTFDLWVNIHGLEGLETLTSMGGGGSSGNGFEMHAGGGGMLAGEISKMGEYGRPEMFITPSSGQVVNAQQIVEAMRSSGVNMSGSGVTIDTLNVYTNSGVDAIQYSIERAKGYAL